MTDYVWYPVTGDGQTQATQFIWNTGTINWNSSNDWVQGSTLVFQNPALAPGAVPGSGGGSGAGQSQGPGKDNVGLVAGDVYSGAKQYYTPNPAKGDPYIGSTTYSVNVLINAGTVDINNLLLASFNQYAVLDAPQTPTLTVSGATFKVEGSIANSVAVLFPTINTGNPLLGTLGGSLQATGGGTIDIAGGGSIQVAGSVQSSIIFDFKDSANDLLNLGAVSAAAPSAFAGTIEGFTAGDTIALPALPYSSSDTISVAGNTASISNGTTQLATLAMSGSFTAANLAVVPGATGSDIIVSAGASLAVATDSGLSVSWGGTGTITAGALLASEANVTPAQLTYSVTSGPSDGTILKNGTAVTTFTQADIDSGAITYQESGGAASSDSFGFTVTDPNKATVNGSFAVTVTEAPAGVIGSLSAGQSFELIYIAYFNRAADAGGFDFWGPATQPTVGQYALALEQGQNATSGLTNIANSFAPQPETIAQYPFLANLGAAGFSLTTPTAQAGLSAFIGNVYSNLFDRAADTAGLNYWVGQVTSGAVGLGAAALAIANGAQGADLIEVENKTTVAEDFTLRTGAAGIGLTPPLSAAFTTAAANVLGGVDNVALNDASVTAAEAKTTAFIASGGTGQVTAQSSAMTSAMTGAAADPNVITVTGGLLDPGAGDHDIAFLPGVAGGVVLHADATDQISGFAVAQDFLDLSAMLAAANISIAALSQYVSLTQQGGDVLVGFDPTGHGGGMTVADLHGVGGGIGGLAAAIAQGTLRV